MRGVARNSPPDAVYKSLVPFTKTSIVTMPSTGQRRRRSGSEEPRSPSAPVAGGTDLAVDDDGQTRRSALLTGVNSDIGETETTRFGVTC